MLHEEPSASRKKDLGKGIGTKQIQRMPELQGSKVDEACSREVIEAANNIIRTCHSSRFASIIRIKISVRYFQMGPRIET